MDKEIKCRKCGDTGSIDTGNNDLVCDCQAGHSILINSAFVEGPISGAETRRHFYNISIEPIENTTLIEATNLPGRNENLVELHEMARKILTIHVGFDDEETIKEYYRMISKIQTLTKKMLGLKSK